jgi:hypothetical protein
VSSNLTLSANATHQADQAARLLRGELQRCENGHGQKNAYFSSEVASSTKSRFSEPKKSRPVGANLQKRIRIEPILDHPIIEPR